MEIDDYTTRMVSDGDYSGLRNRATDEQRERAGLRDSPIDSFFWSWHMDCLVSQSYKDRLEKVCMDDIKDDYYDKLMAVKSNISKTNQYLTRENAMREELEIMMRNEYRMCKLQGKTSIHMSTLKINYDRCCYNIINAEKDLNGYVKDEREYFTMIRIYTYKPRMKPSTQRKIRDLDRLDYKYDKLKEKIEKSIENRFDNTSSESNSLLPPRILHVDNTVREFGMSAITESPASLFLKSLENAEYAEERMDESEKNGHMDFLNVKTDISTTTTSSINTRDWQHDKGEKNLV